MVSDTENRKAGITAGSIPATSIMKIITSAMKGEGEYHWGDVMTELYPLLIAPLTAETRKLFQDILAFEGELHLVVSHYEPHSRSPTEMAKFLVKQKLAKVE